MKVLHVYRAYYPESTGGVEQVIQCIVEGTQKYGIESKVLTLTNGVSKKRNFNGVEVISVKKTFEISSNGFSFGLFSEFNRLKRWADVVHFHYPWPTGDLLSLMLRSKKTIVTYHSDIIRQKTLRKLYKPLESVFLNKVDKIVATSPQYAASSNNLKLFKNKVSVIPLALDREKYHNPTKSNFLKWKRLLGADFFLFVGVLRYYKGLKYLIEAAESCPSTIVIAGDGPFKKELLKLVSKKNINNIKFVGFVSEDDKMSLLKLSRAFVFPSHLRSEAFGVSLLEAQIFSKPIISCDVGTGSNYVNIDSVTGFVVEPGNPSMLAEKMNLLALNDKLCDEFGRNGFNRCSSLFTQDESCKKYFEIYSSVLREEV